MPDASLALDHPLIFKITNNIVVPGQFSARVVTQGRVLMVWEEDAWWCHGVEPGGMTASGDTPESAFVSFKSTYQEILEDLALDASSGEEFKVAATEFLVADETEAERWEKARERVRKGEEVGAPFDTLNRLKETITASLEVNQLSWKPPEEHEILLAEAA